MISEELITVIVPVYNAENYIAKCIKSIQIQTYINLQIILIDDGSTDNSFCICQQIAENDFRIELYHTENRGSVAARKYGLEMSKGSYIGFVDADDYIEPNMFSEMLHILTMCEADFIHVGYTEEREGISKKVYDFDEGIIDVTDISYKMEFLKKHILSDTDKNLIPPGLCLKMFKRELIKKCFLYLPDEQQYGEDLLCFWRCILESNRIVLHKNAMYHYVIRKNSLSHMPYDDYMIKEISLWHYLLGLAEEYKCLGVLKKYIYRFFRKRMLLVLLANEKDNVRIPRYYCRSVEKFKGKRIIIFGAGDVGRDYYAQISRYQSCEIVAWIDSNWREYHFDYAEVIEVSRGVLVTCDVIVIAVRDKTVGMEIREILEQKGVPENKITWQEPGMYY